MTCAITLTFDNGPTVTDTPLVLDVLRRHGIRSTFFVLGRHLQSHDTLRLIEQAHGEGHWIGNHTFTHEVPLGEMTDVDAPQAEIGRTQQIIEPYAHPDKLFRPFGGGGRIGRHLLTERALRFLEEGAYSCVLWNVIPHDWDDPDGWVERALDACRGRSSAVVVLHDYDTGAMKHLESFVHAALAEGMRFEQTFPDDCVPLRRGVRKADFAEMVSAL